jgi:site-specific DNA-methyltransferase (adenine-specific)
MGPGKWPNAQLLKGYNEHDDMMDRQDYVAWQRECLAEMIRVLRDDGVIFYNHKWRVQAGKLEDQAEIVNGHALPVRQIIIWKRSGGINTNPGYFLPTYEVIYVIAGPDFKLAAAGYQYNDVWEITQERDNPHPAPFPVELPRRCIESVGEGIILDPFLGSGTTAMAAIELGRPWIGIDKSQKYCEAARERIALAFSPTKASPQPEREPRRVESYSESEPAWVTPHLPRHNPEEIAESLMADPDNAAAVWRALGARLGLSNQRSKRSASEIHVDTPSSMRSGHYTVLWQGREIPAWRCGPCDAL